MTTQRGRAPVTGPAAWFVRFAGVNSIVCPLGFGGFTIPAIVSVAQGHGILYTFGNPTYGNGPFERIGVPTTLPLLLAFLAACLVQLAGGILLIWLRPSGFVVVPLGMLLSAPFWWGFDLPLAWLNAALVLPFLAAAWAVYRKASRNPSESRRSLRFRRLPPGMCPARAAARVPSISGTLRAMNPTPAQWETARGGSHPRAHRAGCRGHRCLTGRTCRAGSD